METLKHVTVEAAITAHAQGQFSVGMFGNVLPAPGPTVLQYLPVGIALEAVADGSLYDLVRYPFHSVSSTGYTTGFPAVPAHWQVTACMQLLLESMAM